MKSSEKLIKIKSLCLKQEQISANEVKKIHVFSLKKVIFLTSLVDICCICQTHFILISFFVSLPFSLIVLKSLKCTFTKPAETLDQVTPQGFWIQK